MSQKRTHSAAEAVFNNLIAFGISYGINLAVLPYFKREFSDKEMAFWLTFLFSIVSIVRSYFVRRLFNWLHTREQQNKRHVFPNPYPGLPEISKCPHCPAEAIQPDRGGLWFCLNPDCPSGQVYYASESSNLRPDNS